jgi:hypothetical protein
MDSATSGTRSIDSKAASIEAWTRFGRSKTASDHSVNLSNDFEVAFNEVEEPFNPSGARGIQVGRAQIGLGTADVANGASFIRSPACCIDGGRSRK